MSEKSKYISCKYSEGMFPSEYSVTIQLGGLDFSLFAPRSQVLEIDLEKGRGLLKIQVIDPENNVIALPSEVIESGRRFIEYPLEQLQTA